MNRKELTKTFMVISSWEKPFGFQGFHKKFSALRVKIEQKRSGVQGKEFHINQVLSTTIVIFDIRFISS